MVEAGELGVGEVVVAACFVDGAFELDVGQARRDVGERAGGRGDADPIACRDVGAGESAVAMGAYARPLVPERRADLGDARPFAQPVERGGGVVGQDGARAAGHDRGVGARDRRPLHMADGIDTLVDADQLAGSAPNGDGAGREPELAQLAIVDVAPTRYSAADLLIYVRIRGHLPVVGAERTRFTPANCILNSFSQKTE